MITFVCLFLLAALQQVCGRITCWSCTIDQGVIYTIGGDKLPWCLEETCLAQCVVATLQPEPHITTEYRLCYSKIPDKNAALPSYENVCNYLASLKGEDCTRKDIRFCDDKPKCNKADLPHPTTPHQHATTPATTTKERKVKTPLVIGGTVGSVAVLLIVGTVIILILRRRRKRSDNGHIAAAAARIENVIHTFESADQYMTMEEIEELENSQM